jgi:hypothetical protein
MLGCNNLNHQHHRSLCFMTHKLERSLCTLFLVCIGHCHGSVTASARPFELAFTDVDLHRGNGDGPSHSAVSGQSSLLTTAEFNGLPEGTVSSRGTARFTVLSSGINVGTMQVTSLALAQMASRGTHVTQLS